MKTDRDEKQITMYMSIMKRQLLVKTAGRYINTVYTNQIYNYAFKVKVHKNKLKYIATLKQKRVN